MRRNRSNFGIGKILLGLSGVGALVVMGVVATALVLGVDFQDLGWGSKEEPPAVKLPFNPQTLAAYSRVRREDLLDAETGQLATLSLPLDSVKGMSIEAFSADGLIESKVDSVESSDDGLVYHLQDGQALPASQIRSLGGAFLNPTDIVGRVLRRDKLPGLAFSERTFFDAGTPAGLAGATPPGMRTLTLKADRLTGIHRVSSGEKIDLVASVPLNRLQRFELATGSRSLSTQLLDSSRTSNRDAERETIARLVASQAVVLTSVSQRVATESTASLTQGRRVLAVPVEEVVLAVAAEHVAAVTAALELEATINVLVISGRPGATETDRRPGPEGTVAVPIPGKTLPAYQAIDANVFEESATGYIRYAHLSAESVEAAGWITDLNEFIGRIPNRDLPVGQPIHASSLMPIGTPAGLAGATPPGMRTLTLQANRLKGVHRVSLGEKIDLVANIPLDRLERFELATSTRLTGSQLGNTSNSNGRDNQRDTTARLVATQALVLTAVSPRVSSESDRPGRAIEEVVLAVASEDVAAVTAAIELEATINVLVRSGRPGVADTDRRSAPEGMVAVPIPGKVIPAYKNIDSSVFKEAATGYVRYTNLSRESVEAAGWVVDLKDFIGRLPDRDLPAGQPIPENSLMPVGTPEGLAGATPAGRVLFFLDRETLVGADAFGFSQRLDIVASSTNNAAALGLGARRNALTDSQRTQVQLIADDLIVVLPTRSLANPTYDQSSGVPGQLILAVRPEHVGRLQFAVATNARLRATVRPSKSKEDADMVSMRPENETIDAGAMKFNPLENAQITHWHVNGERQRVLFVPKVDEK